MVEEFAHVGTWMHDPSSGGNWWSDGVFALYETDRSISAPPPMNEHFLDGSHIQIEQAIQAAITSGQSWNIKARFRTCKGNIRWVISHGRTLEKDGKFLLVGCFQDITEIERLSKAATQQREFFHSILDNLPHMVFVKEAKDLRFVHFNKAGEDLLGMTRENLLGRNDYDFFPAEQADNFVAKDRNVLQTKSMLTIPEEPIDTPSGKRILRTKKVGLYDQEGNPAYLLGISEDISEMKAQEELLLKQQETLAQSSRLSALGIMAGGVAHEINNPLSILMLVSDHLKLLLTSPNPDQAKIAGLFEKHEATIKRIAHIIRGLRDISRDGRSDPFVDLQVSDVVHDTLSFCQERFRANGVKLIVDIQKDSLTVEGQAVRLSQLLLNLLANAFDAVQGSAEPCVTISCRKMNGSALIEVSDNGPGVAADISDSIMLPFFTTKPVGSGTGLGLSISRTIAKDHGGELSLQSSEAGAVFQVLLPLAAMKEAV